MTENFPLGTLDSVLFTLVILSTAGAGIFQGWVESSNNLSPGGLALPKGRGAFVDVLYRITITTSVPLILGIPTHVYQYGVCVLAACPAIILAQVTALFIILPVFGKANKETSASASSSVEMMLNSASLSQQLSLETYLWRRFKSASLNMLVAILIFTLWTFIAGSIFYGISGVIERITPFGTRGSLFCTLLVASGFTALEGKSRILWTDLVLTLILIGGLLTLLVKGAVDSGGMSTVIEKAVQQNHFQQDSFSFDPTEQDSYISAFFGHYLLWLAVFATFYTTDQKISSHICVTIVHTPFLILIFSILVMIGLVLAVTPRGQQVPPSCDHPANYALRVRWPDQILPNYAHEWLGIHKGLTGFAGIFLAALVAQSLSLISTGYTNFFTRVWNAWNMDESPSGCISSGGSTTIMGKQLFVRLLAMTSTLMAGSLVFLVAGNTDLYEVVFKTTGIILGTLLAIYILGLFVPFARSGKLIVFCGLLSLIFGNLLTIGSVMNFSPSHLPMQQIVRSKIIEDNCSWAVPYPQLKFEDSSHPNPSLSGKEIAKEEYPPHIPVVKTKDSSNVLPRAPVSNWIDPRDIKASLAASFQPATSNGERQILSSSPPRTLAVESGYSNTNSEPIVVPGNSQDFNSHPRTPVFLGGPESGAGGGSGNVGQHYSGNKPPLISGGTVNDNSGGKADNEKPQESNEDALNQHKVHVNKVSAFYRISCHLYSLIGFLFTLLLGTLMSFLGSQVVSPSPDSDPDKATRNFLEPCLLHPIVACCTPMDLTDTSEEKQYREVMYERRKSQMIVSIEDEAAEAAEVANLMARRNSQVHNASAAAVAAGAAAANGARNGYGYENRRMSKVSKRSHRSSIGGGSANGGSGPGAMTNTTTAEVMVNQTQPSIEHIVLERRLSQISGNGINGNGNGDFGPETNDTKFSRSPRSSSFRRRSEMPNTDGPMVVSVPMPQLQKSPQNSVLLAPPTQEQLAQRRFSEVNSAIERHNMRKAAKRSQSVMYRGGRPEGGREGGGNRRKSTLRISNSQNISNSATINASPGGDILNEHDSMALMNRRRKSVKNL